jgi:hypothetical protein
MAALDSSTSLNVNAAPTSSSDPLGAASSAVAITSGGLTFDLLYDAAALAAPPSFRAGIEQAAAMLAAAISDPITVNLNIYYRGTGGGAFAGPRCRLVRKPFVDPRRPERSRLTRRYDFRRVAGRLSHMVERLRRHR